jgi:hypothetical protein
LISRIIFGEQQWLLSSILCSFLHSSLTQLCYKKLKWNMRTLSNPTITLWVRTSLQILTQF